MASGERHQLKRRDRKTNGKDESAQRFVRFSIDPNADEQELQRVVTEINRLGREARLRREERQKEEQQPRPDPSLSLRFASWNISGLQKLRDQHRLLGSSEWDILALQEVTSETFAALVDSGISDSHACSLDLRRPRAGEGKARSLGCAILVRQPWRLTRPRLLNSAPLPERALISRVTLGEYSLTAASFHVPAGVSWKQKKPATFEAIASWLKGRRGPTVLGIDANAPKTDHPNHEQNQWWWDEESEVLGAEPGHRLLDAYRVYLDKHPRERAGISRLRPDGPLEVSFMRGARGRHVPCRYDFVYATPDLRPVEVQYLYQDGVSAGSDHALVVADLLLS